MGEPPFPQRRSDGSFDLVMRVGNGRFSEVAAWLPSWVERNQTWERHWESRGSTEVERLVFGEDFARPPTCEAEASDTFLIRLAVRPGSKWWKDWAHKLWQDIVRELGPTPLVGLGSEVDWRTHQ